MRLLELEPRFIRYEERVDTWNVIVGDHETWRERGCPVQPFTGLRQYQVPVDTLAEAQGVVFLCPACWQKNGGPVGTHGVAVTFEGRGVPDHQGSHNKAGAPSRWAVSGTGLADLTLAPSIDTSFDGGCTWHGHIAAGEATFV